MLTDYATASNQVCIASCATRLLAAGGANGADDCGAGRFPMATSRTRPAGKQRIVLEYIADAAIARRHVDAAIRVEPGLAVDDDAAFGGPHEPRQHLQRQRLAGA